MVKEAPPDGVQPHQTRQAQADDDGQGSNHGGSGHDEMVGRSQGGCGFGRKLPTAMPRMNQLSMRLAFTGLSQSIPSPFPDRPRFIKWATITTPW
jgi:hypothetical protein